MRWKTIPGCILALAVAVPGMAAEPQAEAAPAVEPGVWDEVLRLYDVAKARGEQVPQDVYEWVRQDLQDHGVWEYLVAEVATSPKELLQGRLNELGAKRWECIWIQPVGAKLQLVLKRTRHSYLRALPLSQLLKMIPGAVGGAEGE